MMKVLIVALFPIILPVILMMANLWWHSSVPNSSKQMTSRSLAGTANGKLPVRCICNV